MLALAANAFYPGVGIFVRLVCILGEFECDIQKVNDLFVGFNGDSQSVLSEDKANTSFNALCCSWCAVCYG